MKKLATLTHIVKQTLEDFPETRADDGQLVVNVFERLGISPLYSLYEIAEFGYISIIKSIIRVRAKIQQEREDLCNEASEARRLNHEPTYRAYARSHLSEILALTGEDK